MKKNITLIAMIVILAVAVISNVAEVVYSMNNAVAVNWGAYVGVYSVLTVCFAVFTEKKKKNKEDNKDNKEDKENKENKEDNKDK